LAKRNTYARKGGGDMPPLMLVSEFAHHIGKSRRWVRAACEDGVITACQKVGDYLWVIAEDTLFKPRALKGISNELIDVGLPQERVIGVTYVVPPPEYVEKTGNPNGNPQRKVTLNGWPRIRKELGMGRDRIYDKTGVHPETQKKMERFEPVTSAVAWKLAYSLDKEIEDLLRL
jgi:hypothetical protein